MEQVTEHFEYGDKVEHPVFGIGQVMDFIGDGERLKLKIKFRDHGEKKIAVRHARLKRLNDRPTLAAVAQAAAPEAPRVEPDLSKVIKKTIIPAADATRDYERLDEEEDQDDDDDLEDDEEGDDFESLEELAEDEDEEEEEE